MAEVTQEKVFPEDRDLYREQWWRAIRLAHAGAIPMTELRKLSTSFAKETAKPTSLLTIQLKYAIDTLQEETTKKAQQAKEAMPAESKPTGADAGSSTETSQGTGAASPGPPITKEN